VPKRWCAALSFSAFSPSTSPLGEACQRFRPGTPCAVHDQLPLLWPGWLRPCRHDVLLPRARTPVLWLEVGPHHGRADRPSAPPVRGTTHVDTCSPVLVSRISPRDLSHHSIIPSFQYYCAVTSGVDRVSSWDLGKKKSSVFLQCVYSSSNARTSSHTDIEKQVGLAAKRSRLRHHFDMRVANIEPTTTTSHVCDVMTSTQAS